MLWLARVLGARRACREREHVRPSAGHATRPIRAATVRERAGGAPVTVVSQLDRRCDRARPGLADLVTKPAVRSFVDAIDTFFCRIPAFFPAARPVAVYIL